MSRTRRRSRCGSRRRPARRWRPVRLRAVDTGGAAAWRGCFAGAGAARPDACGKGAPRSYARCWRGAINSRAGRTRSIRMAIPAPPTCSRLEAEAAIARILQAMEKETRDKPNCDAALAAMTRELRLPDEAPFTHLRAGPPDGLAGARDGTACERPDHPAAGAVYRGLWWRAAPAQAGCSTPLSSSSCFSSPDWNISLVMSQPPRNSPFT